MRFLWSTWVLAAACGGGSAAHPSAPARPPAEIELGAAIDAFYGPHLAFRPSTAVELGYHQYDGKIPDRSPAALQAEITRLHAARTRFEKIGARGLPAQAQVEREMVLAEIRRELFDFEVRRRPWREPFWYLRGFSLNAYVARDYAPLPQRIGALLAACEAAPAYYQQAAANLEPVLSRPALQVGLLLTGGALEFVRKDVRAELAGLTDADLRARTTACLDRLADALTAFQGELGKRMPQASNDFALGADGLLAMLRESEGIDIDLPTLRRIGAQDLERNRRALAAAAAQIDPARPVAEVVAEVSADKPAPGEVIAEGRKQVDDLRRFVLDHHIVSVPRDEVAEVRPSPAFFRGNFAGLSGAGPFERTPQPSFFYITPPDPSWPPAEQQAYIPSRADLMFITAHEVWPGHFVQGMHERAGGSRILQTFETYTTSEGWAHYCEEMMWDAGLGNGDPRAHIGELKNALLRDVRFLVALGLHTRGMTIDQAAAMFAEQAYADPGTARQQALRGTADPLFLGYTLGKLAIMKLRRDWQAKMGSAYRLRAFHDEFLEYGEAPLPVIRRMMLGDPAGSLL
jgi:uncharacterized protein (DUF885 family)